jgi:aspartyl-tRNA(Asn)/glutamyl-tRNA(Gln) amidotransferase subunit B
MSAWETVIGLEIHAQLATRSKIFSGSATAYGAPPNAQANLVDLGYPGVLPVLNREAVRMAVKLGLALEAQIARHSVFARKNYFYPDLPKGYQISQYELPVVARGSLDIVLEDGSSKRIGVTRAHLEEDAGKSLHEGLPGVTGIDLNRAGTPLIEIVSEPDMRSAKEAVAYMKKVHTLVRYLEICDGNMQEGSFRCDANVSVRPAGTQKYGTRAEIKNLNSFRFVERAINYEVARQIELLEGGGKVVQETRLYDPDKGETRSMRSKEEANDYRYFPDPDLLPLELDEALIDSVRATLPELPDQKAARFARDYGLSAYDAGVLTASRELASYYEDVVRAVPGEPKLAANWVMGELGRRAQQGQPRRRLRAAARGAARRAALAHRRSDHLRQDRQGGVRDHVEQRRERRRRDRGQGPQADHRRRRHRARDRRGVRQKPGAARRVPLGQGQAVRLLRRAGHEGHRRQGEPRAAQRAAEEEARRLKAPHRAQATEG